MAKKNHFIQNNYDDKYEDGKNKHLKDLRNERNKHKSVERRELRALKTRNINDIESYHECDFYTGNK